jgi:ClpP class serine protease
VSDPKKIERAPFTALTDDARAHMQFGVDAWYGDFLSAIKRGRGARAFAGGNYGGGRMLDSRTAWQLGMVDFIGGGL